MTSTDIDRDPPVTDHVDRRYQSPDGVQEWSMMAVGDVIVAVQYLAPTPPREGFLDELERSILVRTVPSEFAPGGVDPLAAEATTTTTPADQADTGAADESGGP